jgi:hypothetical protein
MLAESAEVLGCPCDGLFPIGSPHINSPAAARASGSGSPFLTRVVITGSPTHAETGKRTDLAKARYRSFRSYRLTELPDDIDRRRFPDMRVGFATRSADRLLLNCCSSSRPGISRTG